MDNRYRNILLLLFFFVVLSITSFNAQNVLKGTVRDEGEGFFLPYTQIMINCPPNMLMTDHEGKFEIKLNKDTCEIEFRFTGYNSLKRTVIFTPRQNTINLDIKLSPHAVMLDVANVVSSKYETNPEKSTNSILILSPKLAEDRNINTIDGLLNTAGGVAVVDNEPQIRGGSGFSSGMGSRVLILLDDIPLLRPDAGRPMWTFIPMEDVEQVDVIKGASSVVFGSSALTGAINVHTAYPRTKPKTKVILFAGMYSDPNPKMTKSYQKNWNHYNPVKFGINFLHSRIIKKNFDFVIGGEVFYDQGYIGPEERISVTRDTDSSTLGKYEKRGRLNFATRYRFAKVKGLSVSVNGNFMYSDNAQSFFWYDADTNRYRTYKGSLSKFRDFTFYIDPSVKYVGRKGFIHSFRNRVIFSNNEELANDQGSKSRSVFNEYQFNKNIERIGMKIVAGVMNNYVISDSRVFNGDKSSTDFKKMTSDNFAIYSQIEQKFLKKRNLIVEAGFRWEFYTLGDESENKPIFRTGLNYQFDKSKTSLRASFGQGYRYPSIGEKFIALSVGRYGFYPNPDLVSEKSWNLEFGIMQPFAFFDFRGMLDVAFFNQRYDNYIEFAMGTWGREGAIMDRLGFKYLNIGPARIQGIDFSLIGEGKISKNIDYTLSLSYTFSNPITLDPNHIYHVDSMTRRQYSFNNSSYDTTRRVLKYRIEHMAKVDIAFTFYKKFSVGISANYYSSMKNVDKFFFDYDIDNPNNSDSYNEMVLKPLGDLPFRGYYNYFHNNQRGTLVFDARISYSFTNINLSLIVKNIFNKSYALRPMFVEPPRTFTLQMVYSLN